MTRRSSNLDAVRAYRLASGGGGSRLALAAEADLAPGLGGRLDEPTKSHKDCFEIGVVGRDTAFEGGEMPGELGVGAGEVTQADEGADDEDAHLDGALAVQHRCGHDRPMLRERPRKHRGELEPGEVVTVRDHPL